MSVTTSQPRPTIQTPWQRIRAALVVLNSAGPVLCELLAKKHGTAQKAAEACGVSESYFCCVRNGKYKASVRVLERMCFEAEATNGK